MAELHVYQRTDHNWAWRLVADNGDIIATDGGQGYEHEAEAEKMSEQVVSGHYRDAKRAKQSLRDK